MQRYSNCLRIMHKRQVGFNSASQKQYLCMASWGPVSAQRAFWPQPEGARRHACFESSRHGQTRTSGINKSIPVFLRDGTSYGPFMTGIVFFCACCVRPDLALDTPLPRKRSPMILTSPLILPDSTFGGFATLDVGTTMGTHRTIRQVGRYTFPLQRTCLLS